MGTRSDIIAQLSDGRWARIYCHWDGYLEHNGRILFDHYTSQEKIDKLMALGDLSVLGPEIGEKHPFDPPRYGTKEYEAFKKKYDGMCVAYGRDRGETETEAKIGETLLDVWPEEGTWTEFTYVWGKPGDAPDRKWWVGSPDEGTQTLRDLGQALAGEVTIRASVKAFGVVIGKHAPVDPAKPQHAWSAS